MASYWMITNRNVRADGLGSDHSGLSYWTADSDRVDEFDTWTRCTAAKFKTQLAQHADGFPVLDDEEHERQQHVTLFVHGYNNDWADAARRYASICRALFRGKASLGTCVLFTWPSDGSAAKYLADREDARRSAPDLATVLNALFDWLLAKQRVTDPGKACRAKTSVIAHSMGNYVLQKAMQLCWTRNNQPLLVSLVNQLLMVAADVDNDLFDAGETIDGSDGDAIANLTYRVTALYSGRDPVLGLSAGIKHFGRRRLGRSGLADPHRVPDNVWQRDCSPLFGPDQGSIHSAYFEEPRTIDLMRQILRGVDRGVIEGTA